MVPEGLKCAVSQGSILLGCLPDEGKAEDMTVSAPKAGRRIWRPQPKQAAFFTRTEDEVLMGGAAFGGKSHALLVFSIRRREKYPRSAGLMLRKTFADLNKEGALIPLSHEMLAGYASWNGTDHKWTFPNGSVLQFGYLQHSEDKYHYQGTMWEDICWDELTQFPNEADYEFVNAFVRTDITGCKPLIRAATNPGGAGHGWVRGRFIDIAPPGETYRDGKGRTRCFIQAYADDNPLGLERNPGYLAHLESLPHALARALRYGDWDQFEGQVFTEWRRDLHVIEPFTIPPEWGRWVAIDYGYANPFCALWLARPPDRSRIYVYRELYQAGWGAREQAKRIIAASKGERIGLYVADPSMWQRRESVGEHEILGTTLADEYGKEGLHLTVANNDRLPGWAAVHEALGWKRLPSGRLMIAPKLQVFAGCVNLIRTLPALPYDPVRTEDVDSDSEDHLADALRYGLMAVNREQPKLPGWKWRAA